MKFRPIVELTEDVPEPIVTRRDSVFKVGIAYKVPVDGVKRWNIDPVWTHFLNPFEDDLS